MRRIGGSVVFDVLRVIDGPGGAPAAVGLRQHVARFDHSMALMGMEPAHDVAALEGAVAEVVAANEGASTVKLVAAWAEVAPGSVPVSRVPSLFVTGTAGFARAVQTIEPLRVTTGSMPKIPAAILPPGLKLAASYTPAIRQQMAAHEAGYDDVVFRTTEGKLAEATTQSLLVVVDDAIHAPPLDTVLDGITRRLLLDLAITDGITVRVADVHWDQVTEAAELIFTSTSGFVRPIRQLDGRDLIAPGPVATTLVTRLRELAAGDHPLTGRWLTTLA